MIDNEAYELNFEQLIKTYEPLLKKKNETEPIFIAKFLLFLFLMILINDTKYSIIASDALDAASSIISFFESIINIYYAKPIQLSVPEEDNIPYSYPPEKKLSREAFFGFVLLAIFTLLGFSNLEYLYAIYAASTYSFIPEATASLIKGLPMPCLAK